MKKTIFLLVLILAVIKSHEAEAQIEKGNWMLGGSISFNRSASDYTSSFGSGTWKSYTFDFAPDIRYFVVDRLAVGLRIPFSYTSTIDDEPSSKYTSYAIGPTLRYYFPVNKKWAIFTDVTYSFGSQVSKVPVYDGSWVTQKATNNYSLFSAGLGTTYFLTPSVGIEGTFSYNAAQTNYDNEYDNESSSGTLSFDIGLQVYFSRNKE
jgi:hypothetical protein